VLIRAGFQATEGVIALQDGSGSAMRDVTLGPGDDVDVVVTGGLRAGDVVMP